MRIEELGRDWGRHMRNSPNGWSRINPIARMGDIGSGHSYAPPAFHSDIAGGQGSFAPREFGKKRQGTKKLKLGIQPGVWQIPSAPARKNPTDGGMKKIRVRKSKVLISGFMGAELQLFHRAWKTLGFYGQAVIWEEYVLEGKAARCVDLVEVNESARPALLQISQRQIVDQIRVFKSKRHEKRAAARSITNSANTPLWPASILSTDHKLPIRASVAKKLPVSFGPNGERAETSIFDHVRDDRIYFRRPTGSIYAATSIKAFRRLRRAGQLEMYLNERREKPNETCCHFGEWYDTSQRKQEKYNTDIWLRNRGLVQFEERVASAYRILLEYKHTGNRRAA